MKNYLKKNGQLKNKTFLITGKLQGISRAEAKSIVENNGGKIVRKFPFVPGIDFSGTVVESEDSKFTKDDKVRHYKETIYEGF